jgi:HAD superfamily hydrolase (TIGR01509 family)
VHSFNAALIAHGRPALPREAILPWIGRPLYEVFPGLEPDAVGDRLDAYIGAYREAFWPVAVSHTRPLPGLAECLAALRDGGLRLAIATHRSERGAHQILEGFGFRSYFDAIVALEHITKPKPDPEPVLKALAHVGVEPNAAAMVGDTPDDMRAGRSAGALAVGVTTGAHSRETLMQAGAHAVLETLADLPDLLR